MQKFHIMDIFGKITNAYKSLFSKKDDENADIDDDSDDPIHTLTLDEMEDEIADDQTALMMQLNPEMRDYILQNAKNINKSTKLPSKIIPISLLTDASTATDIIALLGMIKWAMEKSSKDETGKLSYDFDITCKNRSKSPLLISIGDISVDAIPVQEKFQIGN